MSKSDEESLNELLDFVRFTHAAHKVERVARTPGTSRYATVVEHSYQLTLLAWYLIDKEKLKLNKERVLMYGLAHDLVETYAGDTYLYDTEARETKARREHDALERIRREFSDFTELHRLIEAYERREDSESLFVYALDKLVDPLNIYLDDGKLWQEKEVTFDMLIEKKRGKVDVDPTVNKYFEALLVRLHSKEQELFAHTKQRTV